MKTKRLLLRRPALDDAEALYDAYTGDAEVTRYLTWRPHGSADDTREFLRKCEEMWATGASFPFVIGEPPEAVRPFGMIHFSVRAHGAEFGYTLARARWEKGYMTEALEALTSWCLEQPTIWRVSAFCDVHNPASARVMEKAGMSFEATLRRYSVHPNVSSEPCDVRMYAKVKM